MTFDDIKMSFYYVNDDDVKIEPCPLTLQKKTAQTEVLLLCFRGAQSTRPLTTFESSIGTIV